MQKKKNKNVNNKQSTSKSKKKQPIIFKVINKIMPYILTIAFVILLFSMVGFLGNFGMATKNILCGVFSNFASYFIPFFMLYHAIMWYYDTNRKICIRRVLCSLFALISLSSLQHIITVNHNEILAQQKAITELYNNGVQGQGGGVVGGFAANALLTFGTIIAIIVVFVILTFMLLQMFNITPASMIRAIASNNKKDKKPVPKEISKKKEKIKHKEVDVFYDDDDYDEDNLSYLEESNTMLVNSDDDDAEKNYKNADKSMLSTKTLEDSEQLEPYDANKDYSGKKQALNDDIIVTSSKLGKENEEEIVVPFSLDDSYDYDAIDNENDYDDEKTEESYSDDYEDELDFVPLDDDSLEDFETETNPEDKTENKNEDKTEEFSTAKATEEALEKFKPVPKDEIPVEKKSFFQKFKKEDKTMIEKEKNKEKTPEKVVKKPKKKYLFPPLDFLQSGINEEDKDAIYTELQDNAEKIVTTLNEFNVKTRIVDITRGPTVTRYELAPEAGVRAKAIASHADDIALKLAAKGIRIECPIPGKSAVGIEVPNKITSFVYLKDLLATDKFKKAKGVLTCAVGKSISGEDIFVDIEKTPHLLVAGATGMGKSVCINSLLISMLYKATPDELRLILIDPKRVELSNYNGIPHLLVPVVCEPKKSLGALQWAVSEMDKRFETIEQAGVRNLTEFNEKVDNGYEAEKMSRIVIVIDELADLKMTVPDIEGHITRLTQKARAAGIHIIIGTQRPSVDVITGLIKNNIPSRIAFRVPSIVDSRTILDEQGAEKLVSRGDMLVKIVGDLMPVRVQGSFVTASEIQSVIDFLKEHSTENYDESVMQQIDSNAAKLAKAEKKENGEDGGANEDDLDSEFYNALRIAAEEGKISSSQLQRKLRLGFQRAARIIDQMYDCGFIGEPNGSKPRDVLISLDDYHELMMRKDDEN